MEKYREMKEFSCHYVHANIFVSSMTWTRQGQSADAYAYSYGNDIDDYTLQGDHTYGEATANYMVSLMHLLSHAYGGNGGSSRHDIHRQDEESAVSTQN